jgi:hypothetical protein
MPKGFNFGVRCGRGPSARPCMIYVRRPFSFHSPSGKGERQLVRQNWVHGQHRRHWDKHGRGRTGAAGAWGTLLWGDVRVCRGGKQGGSIGADGLWGGRPAIGHLERVTVSAATYRQTVYCVAVQVVREANWREEHLRCSTPAQGKDMSESHDDARHALSQLGTLSKGLSDS